MTSCYVTPWHKSWQFGGLILNIFECQKKKKFFFFNISLEAKLAYKIYRINFYGEWPNLNTYKISFCKVAVPLVKFAIKGLKMTEKHQNKATLPKFSTL